MKKFELKPFQLVVVDMRGYRVVGELVSYPFPSDIDGQPAIKVRLVPNDPGSMVEVFTSQLKEVSFKPKYVSYAKVSGVIGDFPVDMLRYDSAAPANFSLLSSDWGRVNAEPRKGEIDLVVGKVHETKNPNWTPARWASFGWSIAPLKTLKLEKGNA